MTTPSDCFVRPINVPTLQEARAKFRRRAEAVLPPKPSAPVFGDRFSVVIDRTTGAVVDLLDHEDDCRPHEPNDACGGCPSCLMLQADRDAFREEEASPEDLLNFEFFRQKLSDEEIHAIELLVKAGET